MEDNATAPQNENKASAAFVLGSVGFAVGLFIAFISKDSFWGYVWKSFLFSLIGASIGAAADAMVLKKSKEAVDSSAGAS